ncbi:MAG: hypothetical protein ACLGIJ_10435 [Candidatus Limnocylindria bacterium]
MMGPDVGWRGSLAGVVLLVLAACSAPLASGDDVQVPAATVDRESAAALESAAAPTDTPGTLDDEPVSYSPQSVWNLLATSAGYNSGAQSVAGASDQSELVVVGRFVDLERGDGYGAPGESVGWYAIATIEVDQVLHGSGGEKAGDRIQVPFLLTLGSPGTPYPEKEFSDVDRSRPKEPAVLFLVSWATAWDRIETDVPDWLSELDRPDLFRTIGADGALPLVAGSVSDVVLENDMPSWRLEVAGKDLDAVIAEVVATQASESP